MLDADKITATMRVLRLRIHEQFPGSGLARVADELLDTPSSPRRTLSAAALARYLDHCSELLSLTGKIAALYVQRFDDSVALASVDEIEGLTSSLSGKIWQKLMILETHPRTAAPTPP